MECLKSERLSVPEASAKNSSLALEYRRFEHRNKWSGCVSSRVETRVCASFKYFFMPEKRPRDVFLRNTREYPGPAP